MLKKYGDIISGTAVFLFAAVYYSQIGTIQIIDSASVDAAFIPKIISVLLFLLSSCVIIGGVLKYRKCSCEESDLTKDSGIELIPIISTVVLLVLYVALFVKIGFLISTIIYLFLQFLVLSPDRNIKKTILYAIMSIVTAFILQHIFISLLFVMLPEGILR